jgi:PPM family protein phosphatase
MALTIRSVARSDVGLVRKGNEDSGYAGPRLLAVADGMGGHAAGEVASSATIDELLHVENSLTDGDALVALDSAVIAANDRIRQLVLDDPNREGMGTTLTALLWTGADIRIAHIGDSRAYLLRDGSLRQLTHDHTFVQTLVDDGRITVDEAGVHPARSLILKALDGKPDPEPDLEVLDVRTGDRFLLCSDGLSGVVSDITLQDTLLQHRDLVKAADALVELALRGGGPDNITVVVADVVDTDNPPGPDDTVEAYLVGAASGDHTGTAAPTRRARLGGGPSGSDDEAEPEELRYAPQPPRRFRWLRRLAMVAVLGVLIWAGASLAMDWLRGQYYVGEHAGEVAIYRGVSQEIGPIQLSELHTVADGLPVESLPAVFRRQVDSTITAGNLPAAQRLVADLRREACAAHPPTVRPQAPLAAGDRRAGGQPNPTPVPEPTPTPGYPGLDCPESP